LIVGIGRHFGSLDERQCLRVVGLCCGLRGSLAVIFAALRRHRQLRANNQSPGRGNSAANMEGFGRENFRSTTKKRVKKSNPWSRSHVFFFLVFFFVSSPFCFAGILRFSPRGNRAELPPESEGREKGLRLSSVRYFFFFRLQLFLSLSFPPSSPPKQRRRRNSRSSPKQGWGRSCRGGPEQRRRSRGRRSRRVGAEQASAEERRLLLLLLLRRRSSLLLRLRAAAEQKG